MAKYRCNHQGGLSSSSPSPQGENDPTRTPSATEQQRTKRHSAVQTASSVPDTRLVCWTAERGGISRTGAASERGRWRDIVNWPKRSHLRVRDATSPIIHLSVSEKPCTRCTTPTSTLNQNPVESFFLAVLCKTLCGSTIGRGGGMVGGEIRENACDTNIK